VEIKESGGLVAAILASVGVGILPNMQEACSHMLRFKETIEPNTMNAAVYEDSFQRYLNIYPGLKPVFNTKKVRDQ
jgi:xylulokinase